MSSPVQGRRASLRSATSKSSSNASSPVDEQPQVTLLPSSNNGASTSTSSSQDKDGKGLSKVQEQLLTMQPTNVGYPIYAMRCMPSGENGENRLVVAGGGGASKSGVKNCVTGFTLHVHEESNAKDLLPWAVCNFHHKLPEGSGAVWNLDVHPEKKLVVTGIDDVSELFSFEKDPEKLHSLGKVKTNLPEPSKSKENGSEKKIPSPVEESYQKCVRFCGSDKLITGGTDKKVRIWDYSDTLGILAKSGETLCTHAVDVNDLDLDEKQESLLSVSNEGVIISWLQPAADEKTPTAKHLTAPEQVQVRFGRFGRGKNAGFMYLVEMRQQPKPSGRGTQRLAYISKWSLDDWTKKRNRLACKMAITSFAISPDGEFLAYGTSDGHLGIMQGTTLRRIVSVHSFQWPITAVAFTSNSEFVIAACGSECKTISTRKQKDNTAILIVSIVLLLLLYIYSLEFVQQNLAPKYRLSSRMQ